MKKKTAIFALILCLCLALSISPVALTMKLRNVSLYPPHCRRICLVYCHAEHMSSLKDQWQL